jgi:hypothetical protein
LLLNEWERVTLPQIFSSFRNRSLRGAHPATQTSVGWHRNQCPQDRQLSESLFDWKGCLKNFLRLHGCLNVPRLLVNKWKSTLVRDDPLRGKVKRVHCSKLFPEPRQNIGPVISLQRSRWN